MAASAFLVASSFLYPEEFHSSVDKIISHEIFKEVMTPIKIKIKKLKKKKSGNMKMLVKNDQVFVFFRRIC